MGTLQLIARLYHNFTEGDVQNVIRVALSDQAEGDEPITSRLGADAGTVYHIVESADGNAASHSGSDGGNIPVMIVTTAGGDSLQTTAEGLLEELTQTVMENNT